MEWSPKSNEFCVVYGYIPAKATLFNLKCDVAFDFGTGVRNAIHFNSFGNLVLFGGFGNLRGNIEVWDLKQKKQVSTSLAPDTTLLEWSPTGDVYFTATCAPRLRMSNGFKIWHYSGALLSETMWPDKQDLLELIWQNFPDGTFAEPVISYEKIEGITSSQPQASTAKYVPPGIRNLPPGVEPSSVPIIPGLPPGFTNSKYENRNKRNNNRKNKPKPTGEEGENQANNTTNNKKPKEKGPRKPREPKDASNEAEKVDQNGGEEAKPAQQPKKKTPFKPREPKHNNESVSADPVKENGGDGSQEPKPQKPRKPQRPKKSESAQNANGGGGDETPTGDSEKQDKSKDNKRPQRPRKHQNSTGGDNNPSDSNQNQDSSNSGTPARPRREHRPERTPKQSTSENQEGSVEKQPAADKPRPQKPRHNSTNANESSTPAQQKQPDPDREMKKKINKKLKDIKVLKEKLEKGDKLDANQMTKINAESSLIQQLKSLTVA